MNNTLSSELLGHLQGELDDWPSNIRLVSPSRQLAIPHEILPSLFQGKLTSKVTTMILDIKIIFFVCVTIATSIVNLNNFIAAMILF